MEFRQKQIWLINYDPSFGHEYNKMRPGIIVENNLYIQEFTLLTIIPISSKVDNISDLAVRISANNSNHLFTSYLIKAKQINTFDKRRFYKYIGICEDSIFENLISNIRQYIG